MNRISSHDDVAAINESGQVPLSYLSSLEFQCNLIQKISPTKTREGLVQLIHLTDEEDVSFVGEQLINAKTVEFIENNGESFFRINIENGNQLFILYFLSGTLPEKFETWLRN